jgi:hypothetical protein
LLSTILRLDRDVLRTLPCVAQICAINRAQYVPLRFISNREENGGLGPVRFSKRKLTVSDRTGVILRIHGAILQRNNTNSPIESSALPEEGKKPSLRDKRTRLANNGEPDWTRPGGTFLACRVWIMPGPSRHSSPTWRSQSFPELGRLSRTA